MQAAAEATQKVCAWRRCRLCMFAQLMLDPNVLTIGISFRFDDNVFVNGARLHYDNHNRRLCLCVCVCVQS